MSVRVQAEDFDVGREIAAMREGNPAIGAIASFIGVVRDMNEGDSVATMSLEHYPGMASAGMGDVLTGILAALHAQGAAPEIALAAGVYLHGAAADAALAAGRGPVGLAATETIDFARELVNLSTATAPRRDHR